jgi:Ran GTPase-activating protein (RanGAP) involved in mRNA processing and transport
LRVYGWFAICSNFILLNFGFYAGPSVGKNLGIWLKKTSSLRCLFMNHNRMGEIVRFPTLLSREKVLSAVHDIFAGVKSNKSLEILDLSYNHLGPDSGDVVPFAVNRHPRLHTLDFAGNDLGPEKGTKFIFLLAGFPGGAAFSVKKEAFLANVKQAQLDKEKNRDGSSSSVIIKPVDQVYAPEGSTADSESHGSPGHPLSPFMSGNASPLRNSSLNSPSAPKTPLNNFPSGAVFAKSSNKVSKSRSKDPTVLDLDDAAENCAKPCSLTSISVADNQLGEFSGHAIGSLIERNKTLTHLDVSGNSLGHNGGMLIADQLELMFGIKPREFLKIVLWEIEESKYHGRVPKKRVKIFTTLTSLNLRRNGIGPSVAGSVFYSLANPNCTITNLDLSDNPLGFSVHQRGNAAAAGVDIRLGISNSLSLRYLNISRTMFVPVETVAILGGLVHNKNLLKLQLQDIRLDEPSCLQLCTAVESCGTLQHIDLARCFMGANGSTLVANKISDFSDRLTYLDLTDNYMGPVAAVYISEALINPKCRIKTLRLARNDLIEEGGCFIAKSLIGNISVTDLDLSGNFLTGAVAIYIADAVRGLFENGKKLTDSKFQRVVLNDNPLIGPKASKTLVKALSNNHIVHIEIRNIGAQAGTANLIANSVRDPAISWRILDVSGNEFSRMGLNQIFWALRQNKRLRIFRCGENKAGTKFCSSEDNLLRHGISVPVFLRTNVVLRELDLGFNTMSTSAGLNILDAMVDNHTIKRLSLRGNLIDDSVAPYLGDLIRCNSVLEELDMGCNRLGFACAFALAESLENNRSLKRLILDYNRFGGAGTSTLDAFARSLMMNYSLQVLVMDGNKLGPSWGVRLAETFARNNTLLQVSLRDNRLDSKSGNALLCAYKHCAHLLEMALSSDEIGNELWEKFKEQFEIKRASTAPDSYYHETMLSATQTKILSSYTLFH